MKILKRLPMPLNTEFTEKIFVTGVYGSGKTYFAKKYAAQHNLEYISFDAIHHYNSKVNQSKKILNNLPHTCVMDAIPIDENASWYDFIKYEANNEVLVVCVYCSEYVWKKRVTDRLHNRKKTTNAVKFLIKRLHDLSTKLKNYRSFKELIKSLRFFVAGLKEHRDFIGTLKKLYYKTYNDKVRITYNEHWKSYRGFFSDRLPLLRRFKNVLFYDSLNNEFTTEDTMLERIQYKCFPLKDRLYSLGKDYDKNYQDIEILNLIGYSESYKTWEKIKGLVNWEDKKVIDLGCFHGYFSFKVEDCGGIVQGFDRSSSVLVTVRMINDIRGGHVVFKEWKGGDDISKCDIILCLNSLHHFGERSTQDKAVSKMNCETAIFEIDRDQRSIIEKYFSEITDIKSHRQGRIILLCKKNK